MAKAHALLDYFDYIYEAIDLLPIEEILNALDEVAEELYPLLELYEFDPYATWQEWLQKYIWLIPIFAGKLIYTIFSKLDFIQSNASNDETENNQNGENEEFYSKTDNFMTLLY